MTIVKWLLIAVLGYGALLVFMYVMQRSLQYFPDTTRTAPAELGLTEAEEVILDTADGEKVIAWHVPPRGDKPVVLYFHGNGGSLALRAARFKKLVADGTGLVALSYRGYGGSSGSPSETGILADAAAAHAFAASRYPASRIVLWGESLGTGVAVAIAAERPVARMLLESPYTSIVDIGAATYPFLPVRLLVKDSYRTDLRIGRVTVPVLILHGERDSMVPISHGERVYEMIKSPKRLIRMPDAEHNDHDQRGGLELVRPFIERGL